MQEKTEYYHIYLKHWDQYYHILIYSCSINNEKNAATDELKDLRCKCDEFCPDVILCLLLLFAPLSLHKEVIWFYSAFEWLFVTSLFNLTLLTTEFFNSLSSTCESQVIIQSSKASSWLWKAFLVCLFLRRLNWLRFIWKMRKTRLVPWETQKRFQRNWYKDFALCNNSCHHASFDLKKMFT